MEALYLNNTDTVIFLHVYIQRVLVPSRICGQRLRADKDDDYTTKSKLCVNSGTYMRPPSGQLQYYPGDIQNTWANNHHHRRVLAQGGKLLSQPVGG